MAKATKYQFRLGFAALLAITLLASNPSAANEPVLSRIAQSVSLGGEIRDILHEALEDIGDVFVDRALDRILIAPPPARHETPVLDTKPSGTAVWIPGYWRWDSSVKKFVWKPGVWRIPPLNRIWKPGKWIKTDNGWAWVFGLWIPALGEAPPVIDSKPPPPRDEDPSKPPREGLQWIPGCWEFKHGKHKWKSGEWKAKPKKGMVWVNGKWAKRGSGYMYVHGYWDHPKSNRGFLVPPGHAKKEAAGKSPGKSKKQVEDAKPEKKGREKGKSTGKGKAKGKK